MSEPRDHGLLEDQGSSELTAIIDALRSDGPHRASMRRMAKNLDRTFEAAPTSNASTQSIRLLGKVGVALLATAALLAVIGRMMQRPVAEDLATPTSPAVSPAGTPSGQTEANPIPQAAVHSIPEAMPDPQRSSASQPETAQVKGPSRVPGTRRASGARVGSTARSALRIPASLGTADSARAEDIAPASIPSPASTSSSVSADVVTATARDDDESASPEQAADPRATSKVSTQPEREVDRLPPRTSEASMLQRAQRFTRDQPEEALRMLAEHARIYPNGLLAPEREVLAIQILRAQSRTSEANKRLAAFRERYPHSVYLERLERMQQP